MDILKSNVVRFPVEPRDVPAKKAARRLHLTEAEFLASLDALQVRGFPLPDPTTGMFDLKMIDAWMDQRHDRKVANDNEPKDPALDFQQRLRRLAA